MKVYKVLFFLLALLLSFLMGGRIASKNIAATMKEVQIELGFNHYENYRNIKSSFEDGCFSTALSYLKNSIEQQRVLLTDFALEMSENEFEGYSKYAGAKYYDFLKDLREKGRGVGYSGIWQISECDERKSMGEIESMGSDTIDFSLPVR